jgi:AraC family transcriptional activator of tynA and feaB
MTTWTTLDQPTQHQFSYWKEVLCEAFITLNPTRRTMGGFPGSVTAHPLADINVTTVASATQCVMRGAAEIRKMPLEYYFLNLQLKGECHFAQGGREAIVKPGSFAIVDTTEPYALDYVGDWELYSFRIPKHLLRPLLAAPDRSTAVLVGNDRVLGSLVIDFLRTIASQTEALPISAAQPLAGTMAELVGMALGASADTVAIAGRSVKRALRNSIVKYIEVNVANPALSADMVARHFGISTRYLHKAFELGDHTFAETVLARRLDRCARDLVQVAGQSISEIAFKWGFNEISHFNHAFRRRFNTSPGEYLKSFRSSDGSSIGQSSMSPPANDKL